MPLGKYSRGRRGAPAKGIGRVKLARGFKSLLPRHFLKNWSSGVVVNMPPCHGGDRGFDPRLDRHFRRCSSMVERDLAKVDTGVRFPSPAPMTLKPLKWGFFLCSDETLTLLNDISNILVIYTIVN